MESDIPRNTAKVLKSLQFFRCTELLYQTFIAQEESIFAYISTKEVSLILAVQEEP